MSIKLYNHKTQETVICERPDWTACRDHNPKKGWNSKPFGKTPSDSETLTFLVHQESEADIAEYRLSFNDYAKKADHTKYDERAAVLHEENIMKIRTQGLASNFKVLNPRDSGRKDNLVWVGECDTCGERVFNIKSKAHWEHEVNVVGGKSVTKDVCEKANQIIANKGKNENINTDSEDSVINIGWAFNTANKIKQKISPTTAANNSNPEPVQPWNSGNPERCKGFTAQGTPCTAAVSPEYSNEYCHQHYRQGFNR